MTSCVVLEHVVRGTNGCHHWGPTPIGGVVEQKLNKRGRSSGEMDELIDSCGMRYAVRRGRRDGERGTRMSWVCGDMGLKVLEEEKKRKEKRKGGQRREGENKAGRSGTERDGRRGEEREERMGRTIHAHVNQLHRENGEDDDEGPGPWLKFGCPVLRRDKK